MGHFPPPPHTCTRYAAGSKLHLGGSNQLMNSAHARIVINQVQPVLQAPGTPAVQGPLTELLIHVQLCPSSKSGSMPAD
eukprot:1160637-Pelagomonas_calceolata.AAC.6